MSFHYERVLSSHVRDARGRLASKVDKLVKSPSVAGAPLPELCLQLTSPATPSPAVAVYSWVWFFDAFLGKHAARGWRHVVQQSVFARHTRHVCTRTVQT